MIKLNKKIVKAKSSMEFNKILKDYEERGWKKLSEIKSFQFDSSYPFQVLMGLELEVN